MNTLKRVTALAIVIVWVLLILTTLLAAIIDTETSRTLFRGLIVIDILLPVVAYAIRLMAHLIHRNSKES